MRYFTILFDLDGTLTDPGEGITSSVAYALGKFGIAVTDRRVLYPFIGPPLVDAFMEYYAFSREDALRAVEYYREHFGTVGIYQNELYDGIPSLLSDLKTQGKTLVLATSKPQVFAQTILDHFDLAQYFDHVVGATFDGTLSSKKDVIAKALADMGGEKADFLMVGDRHHDTAGAKANGIDSVGVTYSYGSREEHEKAGATYIVGSIQDLSALLLS